LVREKESKIQIQIMIRIKIHRRRKKLKSQQMMKKQQQAKVEHQLFNNYLREKQQILLRNEHLHHRKKGLTSFIQINSKPYFFLS
jgi:hypothetical protein